MMSEQRCSDCKHLGVIISQMSDYFCYKKRIYMNIDDLSFCCVNIRNERKTSMGIIMSEKRFVCIDVGYGDDWYITDNGKRLSEIEIVDLLNEQQATISKLEEENKKLRKELNDCEKFRYTVFKRIGDVLDE